MKNWHITITENETGETTLDIDTDVIVAGIDEDDGTRVLNMAKSTVLNHGAAICGVIESIKKSLNANLLLKMIVKAGTAETEEN
jgi:hypothetical protein